MAFDGDIPTSPLVSLIHRKQTTYINDKLKDVNLSSGLYPLLINAYKNEGISQEEFAKRIHVNERTETLTSLKKRD
jgi:DNA-binding XRE family transcriptional regulator